MAAWLAIAGLPFLVQGQEPDHHASHHEAHGDHAATSDGLGTVHFPISCAPEVQAGFDKAVALLHSFGYEPSRQAFQEVAAADPRCGMAFWGVAMTYYHPIWAPPTAEELSAGREAAARAAELGAGTDRERGYIEAVGAFYRDSETLDHRTRATAMAAALEALGASFPDDAEAQVFHALLLLGTAPPNDPERAQVRRAGEILNRVLPGHENHPGIVHYTIHSFDYPGLADLALPAARAYAKIAPASPHARHMPSHIFTRLGLWQECIDSNLASEAAANEQVARTHPGAASFDALHALDYLEYAYLQTGQIAKARAVMERAAAAKTFDDPTFAAGYALAAVPARFALEQRDWAAAASLEIPAATLPWERYPYALASTFFARALGAASLGRLPEARKAIDQLASFQQTLAKAPPAGPYDWAGQVESLRLAATGWLARAEGDTEQALALLRQAADLQDRVGKHPVTPGELLPARELLGDLLLEKGRPSEALKEYRASLETAPNRAASLRGITAATKAGVAG
jgi:tetratricopeptide (TPR) repeat protein